jgi:hypothetical protein
MGDSSASTALTGGLKLQTGGYVCYGRLYTQAMGSGIGRACYCKIDEYGNLVWQKCISTSGYSLIHNGLELPGGDLMFFSSFKNLSNNDAYRIFKTDTAGNILWTKDYSTGVVNSRTVQNTIISHDQQILMGATIGSLATLHGQQNVFKLDTAGNILWNSGFRLLNGGDDYLHKICEGTDHNIYMIGERSATVAGGSYPTFSKMDSTGQVLWSYKFNLTGSSSAPVFSDLHSLASGNMLICGHVFASPSFSFVFEADTSGAVVWQKFFNDATAYINFLAVEEDSAGLVKLTGTYYNAGNNYFLSLTTDSTGAIYTAWKMPGYFLSGTQTFASAEDNFFAGNFYTTSNDKWALIKADSIPPFCGVQPVTASLVNKTFYATPDNLSTYVNNLSSATSAVLSYAINNITNGCSTSGLNNVVSTNEVLLFPNPSNNSFTVNIPLGYTALVVYNNLGTKTFCNYNLKESIQQINCSTWPEGIYMVTLINGEQKTMNAKFIVTRLCN